MNEKVRDELPPIHELIAPVFGYAVFQITGAISRIGVPDALGDSARTAADLAAELGVNAPFLHRVLRAGAAAGLLWAEEGERFSLTPLGAVFRSDSLWQGAVHDATHGHPAVWQAWGALEDAVRQGIPAFLLHHGRGLFSYLDDDPELAKAFHATMATGTALQDPAIIAGFDFARFRHVVDIGGGDGTNLASILAANPGLRGTVFDLEHAVREVPAVLERPG